MANENWPAGEYVLLVDKYNYPIFEGEGFVRQQVDDVVYLKGDDIELDARDAQRLGESGSIAKPDSAFSRAAKGELDEAAVRADSKLSLEEKKARISALEAQIAEEEEHVERMEEAGAETLVPVPVAG